METYPRLHFHLNSLHICQIGSLIKIAIIFKSNTVFNTENVIFSQFYYCL